MKPIIYQIFVRNYSKEGTFKQITDDLPRIKDLGVDIIYLMPIWKIGYLKRKGTYGSPYAAFDYCSISTDLGDFNSFQELVDESHKNGMKIILDMVFNHTAPDNPLLYQHPEYYFYRDGKPANKIGDWSDIIDLETSNEDTQEYLLNVLKFWSDKGVDGFRFDVASLIPIEFFKKARERFGNDLFFLAESIDPDFMNYARSIGITVADDKELMAYFDMLYNYNWYRDLEGYYQNNAPLDKLVDVLNNDDNKLSRIAALENHDTRRALSLVNNNKIKLMSLLTFAFHLNASPFIYAGEELGNNHRPELFEKDPIDWMHKDETIYNFVKSLIKEKKEEQEIIEQKFELIKEHFIKVTTIFKDNQTRIEVFEF